MNKIKIKVDKTDNIYFNGEFISNGHFLIRKEFIKLTNKKLQVLVEQGIKFSQTQATIHTGDNCGLPNFESVLNNIGINYYAEKLNIFVSNPESNDLVLIPYTNLNRKHKKLLFINKEYDELSKVRGSIFINNTMLIVKEDNEKINSIIMGYCFPDKIQTQTIEDCYILIDSLK